MQSDLQRVAPPIAVFAVLNFVLAGLCALWLLLMTGVLVYGIGFSGDRGEELAAGIVGSVALAVPGLVGLAVYLLAGFGLAQRKGWGYYCHCAGAVLTAFTCIGLVYTVFAFVFALRPEFSAAFFPSVDRALARRRREIDSGTDA